jgi:hypothetical protein
MAAASTNCISITLKVVVLRLALSHVLFSLAFLKPMYKVLGETHSSQQIPHQKASCPPSASLGKQGGGATVLREGPDIVTRETCIPTSLNINNLGKAAMLYPALFCSWGQAKLSLLIIGQSCAYVKFS